ncbi:MAG: SWIM zinc finger family protein [Patescibacteria group bacterium]
MLRTKYTIDKIKFSVDQSTFEKATELLEMGKVVGYKDNVYSVSATVLGGNKYKVVVDKNLFDAGTCDCYLGKNNTLCKHMVAVALKAALGENKIPEEIKNNVSEPKSSGKIEKLNKEELIILKQEITNTLKFIKGYNGPSRIWFAYQNSLSEGCRRLTTIVNKLPVCPESAEILVDLLLRLDRKLMTGGVDDSDGTVGDFMYGVIDILLDFTKLDPSCKKSFEKLRGRETCFGWEDKLLSVL